MRLDEIKKKDFVKILSDETHGFFMQKFKQLRKEAGENWKVSVRDKSNKFLLRIDPVGKLRKDLEADVNYDELEETEIFRIIDIMHELFPRSQHKYGNTNVGDEHTIGYILYK